jgi:hypothetical protein
MKMKNLAAVGVLASLLCGGLAAGEEARKVPIIAIFLMESKGSPLTADEVASLTDYMSAKLGEGGRFQVIPRDEIKKHLVAAKTASYKDCYDASCQIQIGKELAAEFSISSAVSKVGSQCLLYASVWDLAKSTQIKSATVREKCDPELLIEAVERIVDKIDAAMDPNHKDTVAVVQPPVIQPKPVVEPQPVEPPVNKPVVQARPGGQVSSRNLALASAEFDEGAAVTLTWFNTPGNISDWVTVAVAGTADNQYWDYTKTGGQVQGTYTFEGLPVGSYEARLYLDWDNTGSYTPADRIAFSLVNAGIRSLTYRSKNLGLAKQVFSSSETITVQYFGTTGDSHDWYTVVPKGTADNETGQWDRVNDVSGTWEVSGLSPGEYEVRIYLDYRNKGYVVTDRLPFSVR